MCFLSKEQKTHWVLFEKVWPVDQWKVSSMRYMACVWSVPKYWIQFGAFQFKRHAENHERTEQIPIKKVKGMQPYGEVPKYIPVIPSSWDRRVKTKHCSLVEDLGQT